MPVEILEKKLKQIPTQYFDKVSTFLDLVIEQSQQTDKQPHRKLGLLRNQFQMSEDFKDIPEDFEEYL